MGMKTIPFVARQLAESSHTSPLKISAVEVAGGSETYMLKEEVFQFLDSEWYLAQDKYELEPAGKQKALAQVTLLALGIEAAATTKGHVIGLSEIMRGWKGLKVCGVGELPHQCLGKAIVERQGEFMSVDTLVGRVLRDTAKELDIEIEFEKPGLSTYRSSE